MRELVGTNADILFDLEQIKILSREKTELNRGQQNEVDRLPTKKARKRAKEEMLAQEDRRKREFLRMWVLELEEKVKSSGLPPDIVNKILEMTVYARERDMTFIYDIERKIEQLKIEVKEAEAKQAAQQAQKAAAVATGIGVGAVVAGAVLAPFVQVRYNKEEYEKKTTEYYEEKLAKALAFGGVKERPATPTYATKKGSAYSKRTDKMETDQKAELQNALVKDVQARQKAAGVTVQSEAEILEKLDKMYPVQRRAAERATYQANPEMKARHEAQKKEVAAQETLNGLLRAKRASQKAALKALETQKAKLMKEARTPETTEQIASRLAALDERIAVRQKEVASLGLFMDNFEKVLKQNNTTASQILNAVTVKGRRNMDVLTDQVVQMNMQGLAMRHEPRVRTTAPTQQRAVELQTESAEESKGISARLKAVKEQPQQMTAVRKEVEKSVAKEVSEKKTARKTIRPKIRPKSVKELGAAKELRKIIGTRKSNTQALVKNAQTQKLRTPEEVNRLQAKLNQVMAQNGGVKAFFQKNSAVKSEKRVREESQLLMQKKAYDRVA